MIWVWVLWDEHLTKNFTKPWNPSLSGVDMISFEMITEAKVDNHAAVRKILKDFSEVTDAQECIDVFKYFYSSYYRPN